MTFRSALDGPLSKLDRAAEDIQMFNDAVKSWLDINPVRMVNQNLSIDKTRYIYRFEIEAMPIFISVMATDALHNMRSALDHLAYELMMLTPVAERPDGWAKKIEFPIFMSIEKDSIRKQIVNELAYFPEDTREVIKGLQPFNATLPVRPEFHRLWILHQLSKLDSNRIVNVGVAIFNEPVLLGAKQNWLDDYIIEVSVPTVDNNLPAIPPKMDYYLTLGYRIIGKNGIRIEALAGIHELISNVVLPRFARFFPA